MSSKAKKIMLASLLLLASCVYSSCPCPEDCCNNRCKPGYPVDRDCMIGGYNAQGRIDVCGSRDFYASGTFLYWEPKEQGLDIALITPIYNPTVNDANNLNTDFDYQPGFKITLGLFLLNDNWGLQADYTRFHTKNRASGKADPLIDTITNYWRVGTQIDNLISIISRASIDMDFIDLSIGRPYYMGTNLIFNPYIGVRGGLINQRNIVRTETSRSLWYETKVSSDSWFVGPKIGICTNWLLADGFRFFGDGFSSLFYQNFKVAAKEFEDRNPSLFTTNASNTLGYINVSLDLSIGIGWGKYFHYQKLHIDATVGYELEVMWNQNQMRAFIEEIKHQIHSNPGNLTPHGFIVALRLDF